MNLDTAKAMLDLLQRSSPSHELDDSYYIIERLLQTEIRKGGEAQYVCAGSHQAGVPIDLDQPTNEEILAYESGDKVLAIKMYRQRTGHGLYDSKKAMEESDARRSMRRISQEQEPTEIVRVTSCG